MKLVTAPPQSQQVAEVIRAQIKSNKIKPGQRLESVRRLAEKFSVGRQVVLSAFDILASEGLVFSHVGRGTFASNKTFGTVSSKNYRIGFYINQSRVETFYNRNVFLGASEKAGEAGVTMLLAPDDDGFELDVWTQRKQLDGLLVSGRVDASFIKILNRLDIPFVIIGNYNLPDGLNVIESYDDNMIIEAMAAVCNKFKCKSVGAILGAADIRSTKDLAAAIVTGVNDFPVECDLDKFSFSNAEDGYLEAKKMFEGNVGPEALFVTGQAFPGVARYIFEMSSDASFKRPVIITSIIDRYNIMYPELIDVAIYGSAREMGNSGIAGIIKLLDGEVSQVRTQVNCPGFELL